MQYDPTFPMMILNNFLWFLGYILVPLIIAVFWVLTIMFFRDTWREHSTATKTGVWLGNAFGLVFVVFLTGFFIKL